MTTPTDQAPNITPDIAPDREWPPVVPVPQGQGWLITSFTTWRPDQPSNAADDLLSLLVAADPTWTPWCLRQLPVATPAAVAAIQARMRAAPPTYLLCCGMAESRSTLSLERYGKASHHWHETSLPLPDLVKDLACTTISEDAGNFVCNEVYYALLDHCQPDAGQIRQYTQVLFVHVPRLTAANQALILQDFQTILARLEQLPPIG